MSEVFVSVTRLRLRSLRFLPAFAYHAVRSRRQAARAPGFLGGSLLADRRLTFWTMMRWTDADAMRRYMRTGEHRTAMPKLARWCDEASVAHWTTTDDTPPSWLDAAARMRSEGRPSRLDRPGPHHADLGFDPPRDGPSGSITPMRD